MLALLSLLALPRHTSHAQTAGDQPYDSGMIVVELASRHSIKPLEHKYQITEVGRVGESQAYEFAVTGDTPTADVVERLADDQRVLGVEPDWMLQAPENAAGSIQADPKLVDALPKFVDALKQYIQQQYDQQWSVPAIGLDKAHAASTGDGMTVAVVDTGVQTDHPYLQDHLVPGYDFVDDTPDVTDPQGGMDAGHGTFIAGLIALAAPDANIMPLRVLNADGEGDEVDVANAIYWAVNHGANIINLSLGSYVQSDVLDTAVSYAEANNVLVVSAAGNDNTNQLHYPAASAYAMGVAAVDELAVKTDFSNYGSYLAVSAPGVDLYSTYDDGAFAFGTGTSFATAIVSGVAALAWSVHRDFSVDQLREELAQTALNVDALNSNYAGQLGAGEIQAASAVLDWPGTAAFPPAPTGTPTAPVDTPLPVPTETPTSISSNMSGPPPPTDTPTDVPTDTPTDVPTDTPTDTPTDIPTDTPTDVPTDTPTDIPTDTPTDVPTDTPTDTPTDDSGDTPTPTPAIPPDTLRRGGSQTMPTAGVDCLARDPMRLL